MYWLFLQIRFCLLLRGVVQQLIRCSFGSYLLPILFEHYFLHFSVTYTQISDRCVSVFCLFLVFCLSYQQNLRVRITYSLCVCVGGCVFLCVFVSIICNEFFLHFKFFTKIGVITYKTFRVFACVFGVRGFQFLFQFCLKSSVQSFFSFI